VDVYMQIDARSKEEQRMHWSPGVIPRCAYPAGSKVVLMLNSEPRSAPYSSQTGPHG
jgi:hypothetical protein